MLGTAGGVLVVLNDRLLIVSPVEGNVALFRPVLQIVLKCCALVKIRASFSFIDFLRISRVYDFNRFVDNFIF